MLRFEEIHTEVLCREVEESLETHQILVMFFFQYNNCDHHGISTLGMVGFWTWRMMGMSEKGNVSGDGSKPWYLVNPKIAGKWMFIPLKMYL